jgi:hypothetical protein
MRTLRALAIGLAVVPALAFSVRAHAGDGGAPDAGGPPPCFDATARPNPIYVAGGDTALISALATILGSGPTQVTIVNVDLPSCLALGDLVNKTALTGTAAYFDASGNQLDCTLDAAGNVPDLAFSDSFAATCGFTLGSDIGDFFGPVTPQVFAVPNASTQKAISAEAAYDAFGVNDGASKPWVDPSFFFVRDKVSGTQQVISTFIDVPADQWWGGGKKVGGHQIIAGLSAITSASDAEKAIGTLTTEDIQPPAVTANLRILAFQAKGQIAAFWPDSSVDARDKRNVRDGHYAMWGPLHLFANLVNGQPSVAAAPVVNGFSQGQIDKAVLDAAIDNFFVPQCAMRVRRTSDGGPLSPFVPEVGCGCYFESRAAKATTCKACSSAADCPTTAPKCNYGFCEVQ